MAIASGNTEPEFAAIGTPNTTPEPSSLLLVGAGLIGVGSKAWKRFLG